MNYPKSEHLGFTKGPDDKWYGLHFYGENEGAAVITGPSPEPGEGLRQVPEVHREPAVDAADAGRKLVAWQVTSGWTGIPVEVMTQQRMKMIETNFDEVVACHGRSLKNGVTDCVVVILDIHDSFARAVSKLIGGGGDTDAAYRQAKEEGRILTRCVAIERKSAIKLLAEQVPQLANTVPQPLESGMICVIALSAGGSYCAVLRLREPN